MAVLAPRHEPLSQRPWISQFLHKASWTFIIMNLVFSLHLWEKIFEKFASFSYWYTPMTPWGGLKNLPLYRCFTLKLSELDVVLKKFSWGSYKRKIVNERWTTHDDRRRPIAQGHLMTQMTLKKRREKPKDVDIEWQSLIWQ